MSWGKRPKDEVNLPFTREGDYNKQLTHSGSDFIPLPKTKLESAEASSMLLPAWMLPSKQNTLDPRGSSRLHAVAEIRATAPPTHEYDWDRELDKETLTSLQNKLIASPPTIAANHDSSRPEQQSALPPQIAEHLSRLFKKSADVKEEVEANTVRAQPSNEKVAQITNQQQQPRPTTTTVTAPSGQLIHTDVSTKDGIPSSYGRFNLITVIVQRILDAIEKNPRKNAISIMVEYFSKLKIPLKFDVVDIMDKKVKR